MHECWSNIHKLSGSSICQLLSFYMYTSSGSKCCEAKLHIAYICTHVCPRRRIFPRASQPSLFASWICQRKNKIHNSVNLFENNNNNDKLSITTGLCPDPTSSGGPLSHYYTNIKKADSLIMLVTPLLLYHTASNHTVAANGRCSLGSY